MSEMKNNTVAYTLKEISEWQLEENSAIKLPSLQRGFVWKAHQIETLWDSILRGYPIGAVLMSVDSNTNKKFLLDGQQRSTSIALGYLDPFSGLATNKHFFSIKDNAPSIWIDLMPSKTSQNQVFNIKALTKSHPWGYKTLRDNNGNGVTISMSERKNAIEYFKTKEPETKRYIDLDKKNINPWDANYPVPLSWLLNTVVSNFDDFKSKLIEKLQNLNIQTQYSKKENVNFDFKVIDGEHLLKIYEGIIIAKNLLIPEINVKSEILKNNDEQVNESEDPTLFVRLNSSGTRIGGEELIYSMYKAAFPQSKDLVENIGKGFIAPSKIINLFSRLVDCKINGYASFIVDYKINTFRERIKNDDYRKAIDSYIETDTSGTSKAQKLIETAIKILRQGKIENDKVPDVLIKQWIVNSPDLFLVLLAYIEKHELHQNEQDLQKQTKTISANFVYILWFSNEIKNTPASLFELLKKTNSWESAVQELIGKKQLIPLIPAELLRNTLIDVVVEKMFNFNDLSNIKSRNLIDEKLLKIIIPDNEDKANISEDDLNRTWTTFINKICWNKSFLLYAQRNYINEKFGSFNQIESIEDTNRPWDWDHIYPQSWVANKEGINPLVRSLINCNGNYRALSYDDNRKENNNLSPSQRLTDDNKEESFIKSNDLINWKELTQETTRIKTDKIAKYFLSAVIQRMVNIYEEWLTSYFGENKI